MAGDAERRRLAEQLEAARATASELESRGGLQMEMAQQQKAKFDDELNNHIQASADARP